MKSKKNHKSLAQELFSGGSIVLLFSFLSAPIGYFIRVLHSRTMSVEDYGIYYAVLTFIGLFVQFNDLGFGNSVIYFVPKFWRDKKLKKLKNAYSYGFYIELFSSVFLAIIIALLANFLSINYFHTPKAASVIIIFAIYLIINSLYSALRRLMIGLQLEFAYSSYDFLKQSLLLIFSLSLVFLRRNTPFYFAVVLSSSLLLIFLIYRNLILKKFKFLTQKKLTWDLQLYQKMWYYAWPTLLSTSVGIFTLPILMFYLTLFHGVKEVGVFNAVMPLAAVPFIFISPLSNMIRPYLSKLIDNDKAKVTFLLNQYLKILPFFIAYFSLFTMMFRYQLVKLILGAHWLGLVESPLWLMALLQIIILSTQALSIFLSSFGLVKEILKISLIGAMVASTSGLILIKFYAALGAIMANGLMYLILICLILKYLYSKIKFKLPYFYYLKLLLGLLIIFLLVNLLGLESISANWFLIIPLGVIYSLIYFLFGLTIGVINDDLRAYLQVIFKPMAKKLQLRTKIF